MMHRLIAAASAVLLTAPLAVAGPVGSACLASARAAGNGPLCGCIQQVADQTLSRGDQRRAAAFFRDADKAQAVKMSRTGPDNAFWNRYERFADAAEAYCR